MPTTAFDFLQSSQQAAIAEAALGQQRVAQLDGYVLREFGILYPALGAGASADIILAARTPAYVLALSAAGSLASGFEFQLQTDGEGRFFASPILSSFSSLTTADGMTLTARRLVEPRFFSGALRVRVRNLATTAPQECALMVSMGEPRSFAGIPEAVLLEQLALSRMALGPSDSGIASRLESGAGGSTGVYPGDDDMESRAIDVELSGGRAILLEADESASREVWSLQLFLEGTYLNPVTTVAVIALNSRGGVRVLAGPYHDVLPGSSIAFPMSSRRYWTLEPGENLQIETTNTDVDLASWSGMLQFRHS